MNYRIALNFEDGVTRFIECQSNETVLDAAYRQKINLPMDCSDGVCGTCKGRCEQGRFDLGDEYLEEALSDEESAEGMVLTCQMVPSSDCVIAVPAASTLCKTGIQSHAAALIKVETLSEDCLELTLELEDQGVDFLPGQYVNIEIPGEGAHRSYSFSSRPGERQASFLIRNVPEGRMSDYLGQRARPGDRLVLEGPLGGFYLRPVTRPILMLAGGTGLAPMLSMLEQLAVDDCTQPIHLVYGVNRDDHLVKCEALDALAARLPDFAYTTVVVDEKSEHPRKGYVTHHLASDMLHDGNVDVYLCGPPPMVDAVLQYFRDLGVQPGGFHYEKFTPKRIEEAA